MRTPATSHAAHSSTGPLALWLIVQLGVVALAAARVPLAAQYVEPAEHLAPHLLLGAQVVMGALLFPFLLRDVRCAAQVIATAIPFQLAATHLAGLAVNDMLEPAGFVAMWLVTLTAWAGVLRSATGQMLGVAVAGCLTLGGAVVRYLRFEFSPDTPAGLTVESVSPLLATVAALEGLPTFLGWGALLCLSAGGLLMQIARRRRPPETPAAAVQ